MAFVPMGFRESRCTYIAGLQLCCAVARLFGCLAVAIWFYVLVARDHQESRSPARFVRGEKPKLISAGCPCQRPLLSVSLVDFSCSQMQCITLILANTCGFLCIELA